MQHVRILYGCRWGSINNLLSISLPSVITETLDSHSSSPFCYWLQRPYYEPSKSPTMFVLHFVKMDLMILNTWDQLTLYVSFTYSDNPYPLQERKTLLLWRFFVISVLNYKDFMPTGVSWVQKKKFTALWISLVIPQRIGKVIYYSQGLQCSKQF